MSAPYSRSTPALSHDGGLVFGFADSFARVITSTGQVDWYWESLTNNLVFGSSPVIANDGTMYFGHDGLWSLEPSGNLRWVVPFARWNHSSPAIGPDGSIYIVGDYHAYAFRPDGSVIWSRNVGYVYGIPAIDAQGVVYVPGRDIFSQGNSGAFAVFALEPDGSAKWTYENNEHPYSEITTPVTVGPDNSLYFATMQPSRVFALDANGNLKWKMTISRRAGTALDAISAPIVVDRAGNAFVCADNGSCYGISHDGKLLWEYFVLLNSWNRTAPLITNEGEMVILDGMGILHGLVTASDIVYLPLIARE